MGKLEKDGYSAKYLPVEGKVIIGVSGGADSLCLLALARQVPFLEIIVAHFDHQLRPGTAHEVAFVHAVAEKMKLHFVTGSSDVGSYASGHKLSLEEAARKLRYQFLFSQARLYQASAVAVGHTADDQVETILMHFLRGTGLDGLKGMTRRTLLAEFDLEIPLVRPILHLWRNETASYCHEHDLQPIQDPSNADETYLRNRLRHSLIPELEKYNPRIKSVLLRTAEALASDYETLTEAVDSTWLKVVVQAGSDHVIFRASALNKITPGLRRNIFRKAMESIRPNLRNLDFDTLERASQFVETRNGASSSGLIPRQVDLTEGLHLYREGEMIFLAALEADLPSAHWPLIDDVHQLQIGRQVVLNEHFFLSAVEMDVPAAELDANENRDSFSAWLDADLTGDDFTVRTRQAGDGFSPLGMNRQTVKIREFFINSKIPMRARSGWPLVCARGQIAWVPGFRLAHPFRITERTKRVVKLSVHS